MNNLLRCLALCTPLLAVGVASAATVADVAKTSDQWASARTDSQKKVDALAQERGDLSDKYRATLRESEGVRLYIQQLQQQIKSQADEVATIHDEISSIERTSIDILPLMQNMLASLQKFVSMDMPFLLDERRTRLQKLNDMMPRADVTVSEKYRRIVEAYQIEMDYGRTIEAYTEDINGKRVDVLRVGRVAMLYQTPDAKETAYWDLQKGQWVVDNHYKNGVRDGLKIARKQTSPDLLSVPVKAAAQGG